MKNCKQLQEDLKGGENSRNKALIRMHEDQEWQKIAKNRHQCSLYPRVNTVLEWPDILSMGIERFLHRVLSGAEIRKCDLYFFGICDKLCKELERKLANQDN